MKQYYKRHFLAAILFLTSMINSVSARQCTAIVNGGDWSNAATWSCGVVPGNNDTMTIPAGITVEVNINSPTYSNMLVIVNGTLDFQVGQKINICPGGVEVNAGGQLTGGNGGSKIVICGSAEWTGPGPTSGPVSYGTTPLPVELLSFTGIANDEGNVVLQWSTGSETNNHYFFIERSVNGLTFDSVGVANGNGTTSQRHDYTLTDLYASPGTNYYRLTQVDFNGQARTYPLIAVNVTAQKTGCVLTVFPNPCSNDCHVTLSDCPDDNDGQIQVEMINATGQVVSSFIPERNANGGFSCILDTRDNLKPGVYIIRGVSAKNVYQQKAVLK